MGVDSNFLLIDSNYYFYVTTRTCIKNKNLLQQFITFLMIIFRFMKKYQIKTNIRQKIVHPRHSSL